MMYYTYCVILMRDMFRFKHKKPSSVDIKVPNNSYNVNYIHSCIHMTTFIWHSNFDWWRIFVLKSKHVAQ